MEPQSRLSANRAGAVAETIVSTRLIRAGFNVARPEIPCRYDLVVDLDGDLVRTQVKRGFEDSRDETLRVNLLGSVHKGATEYESVQYTADDIDAFAIYDPINDTVYWLWFEEAPATELRRKYNSLVEHTLGRKLKSRGVAGQS
ncbi:group I intron-associated PD-(D/E)XK endonuclease [Halobaculum roseum]|uniref:Group I intron-associated PD-(D/E)XK endonuclease n=1 Tax=Halobaculum roseum TaxID=2175149 RepID=A0ABD5MFQ2_9EURY